MSEGGGERESVRKIRALIPALYARGGNLGVPATVAEAFSQLFGVRRLWPGSPRPNISALCQHKPTQRGTRTIT